jgi:hypothetical protein
MNSPSSEPKPVLPDPSTLTSELRLQYIQRYRDRRLAGEDLTIDEYKHAIACISADRAAASKERTKSNKAAASAVIAPSLEDL